MKCGPSFRRGLLHNVRQIAGSVIIRSLGPVLCPASEAATINGSGKPLINPYTRVVVWPTSPAPLRACTAVYSARLGIEVSRTIMGYLQFEVGFDREDAPPGGRAARAIGGSRHADRRLRRADRGQALTRALTLVTHNTGEFQRVPGLRIEDWE